MMWHIVRLIIIAQFKFYIFLKSTFHKWELCVVVVAQWVKTQGYCSDGLGVESLCDQAAAIGMVEEENIRLLTNAEKISAISPWECSLIKKKKSENLL